jgi:glucuronate isomerase
MVVTRMLVNCSIENLSITGSFENKEHYQEYASILMTWDVGG